MGTNPAMPGGILVIGVGNPYRNDDRAGLVVTERLARRCPEGVRVLAWAGDGTELLGAWQGAAVVLLVDAQKSGAPPGTIARYASGKLLCGGQPPLASSHGFGVIEAVRMGAVLGQLPKQLAVYGIEGKNYAMGTELSPEVDAAVDELVDLILEELACTSTP